jgi:integrase
MIIDLGNRFVISTVIDDEVVTLDQAEEWSLWMLNIRNYKKNSVLGYMKSIERFWIWTLNNPSKNDEIFSFYEARYRKALLDGFEILYGHKKENEVMWSLYTSEPLLKKTINKELVGIRSYFEYTEQEKLIEIDNEIDMTYQRSKSRNSFLGSVGVKASSSWLKTFGKRKAFLAPYKVEKKRNPKTKAFPYELFRDLLAIAKPREKLIYLLCGACSARIGQALNFTLYDYDIRKKEVWLIDPRSDEKDIYGRPRRQFLRQQYGIDIDMHPEHGASDLQFKYPIPLEYEPLYWVHPESFRDEFFKTLEAYFGSKQYCKESSMNEPHPFVFMTRTGRRLHSRGILFIFKRHLEILKKKKPELSDKLPMNLGLHSLRHMFGAIMGEIYAQSGDETLIHICQHAMGHSQLASTMVYFDMSTEARKKAIARAGEIIFKGDKNEAR